MKEPTEIFSSLSFIKGRSSNQSMFKYNKKEQLKGIGTTNEKEREDNKYRNGLKKDIGIINKLYNLIQLDYKFMKKVTTAVES